jgi:hypothetical protein
MHNDMLSGIVLYKLSMPKCPNGIRGSGKSLRNHLAGVLPHHQEKLGKFLQVHQG